MSKEVKFYKDKITGNTFVLTSGKINESDSIVELKANTVEASIEKHIPVYKIDGNTIHVTVGSVEHPMSEEHYIMWIAQVYDGKVNITKLNPTDFPKATFKYIKDSEIYAYCNLHGLWKTSIE